MHFTRWLLVLLLVMGCAVRKRDPKGDVTPQSGTVSLPEGVVVSRDLKYLVKADLTELVPGQENTIHFSVVDGDLDPVDLSKAKIQISYKMPGMPQMGVFTTTAKDLDENSFDATFEIVHGGGIWSITVSIQAEESTTTDEVVFEYNVK